MRPTTITIREGGTGEQTLDLLTWDFPRLTPYALMAGNTCWPAAWWGPSGRWPT
jgi:hypothetical protein